MLDLIYYENTQTNNNNNKCLIQITSGGDMHKMKNAMNGKIIKRSRGGMNQKIKSFL
jgi:hypothetical protein